MIKLGQNFLTSPNIAKAIVESANIESSDVILEVGPGKGILTEELIKYAKKVIAVEKDIELVEFLKEKFEGTENLEIIQGDILDFTSYQLPVTDYKIVANLPYYLTSHFLRQFLSVENQPKLMVLMIQKEVGERILAKDKKESILSISVKAYGNPKIIKNVSARHFLPKPKVDSVVIKIDNISRNFFVGSSASHRIDEKEFFKMVKLGFSQKRKMLKNNLKISGEILKKCLPPQAGQVSEKARAEKLSLKDWKCLYNQIKK